MMGSRTPPDISKLGPAADDMLYILRVLADPKELSDFLLKISETHQSVVDEHNAWKAERDEHAQLMIDRGAELNQKEHDLNMYSASLDQRASELDRDKRHLDEIRGQLDTMSDELKAKHNELIETRERLDKEHERINSEVAAKIKKNEEYLSSEKTKLENRVAEFNAMRDDFLKAKEILEKNLADSLAKAEESNNKADAMVSEYEEKLAAFDRFRSSIG